MNTTLLAAGRVLNTIFSKASMLAKLAMCFNMALAYFILVLYKEGLELNNKILTCHEARVKDLTAVLERVQSIDNKVNKNTSEIKEINGKVSYYDSNGKIPNDSQKGRFVSRGG